MNVYFDEFDITKIKDKKKKKLLKKREKHIKKLEEKKKKENANFLDLDKFYRKKFKNKNHKLYHEFSKAVEKLPLKYINEEIEISMNKLKQLILMRQFLKPYLKEFIFSDQRFLSNENDKLEEYRGVILKNIENIKNLEKSFTDLETYFEIDDFDNIPNKRFSRNSSRSLGTEPITSPGNDNYRINRESTNNRSTVTYSNESKLSLGKKRKTKGKKQRKRNSSRTRRSAKKKM